MCATPETTGSVEIVDSMVSVEFDAERELFRATYDSDRDPASMAVVAVVAAADNRDPVELSPLYSTIDGSALDVLFSESTNGKRGCDSTSFNYEGFEVTVFREGTIEAVPVEGT